MVTLESTPLTKSCTRCKTCRPIFEFSINVKSPDGHCDDCKDCQRAYYQTNIEKRKEYGKIWRKNNLDKLQVYRKTARLKQEIKIRDRFRKELKEALNCESSPSRYLTKFGCSIRDLKNHLASQFKEGMTWNNRGSQLSEWCVDHIIPHTAFNYSEPSHVYWCWSYRNMQPLWGYENAAKIDKIGDSNVRQYLNSNRQADLHALIALELERLGITTKEAYLASVST